jgi:hypothetical protein
MEAEYKVWTNAVLRGKENRAQEHESNLLSMVNRDIYFFQERVRQLALEATLASAEDKSWSSESTPTAERDKLKTEFQESVDRLNTKEMLYRSLTRTCAFSNKYRLLGDYIDLLRRELDLPRLKLAKTDGDSPGMGGQ